MPAKLTSRYKYGRTNLPPFKDPKTGKKKSCLCYFSGQCDLWKQATHVCVQGRGNETNPKLMLIGEAPGGKEDQYNKPFVGPAGDCLTEALTDAEVPSADIFITNLVRCIPRAEGHGTRAPTQEEISVCSAYLVKEIERVKPDIIVPMGNTATDFLLGEGKISQRRSRTFEASVNGSKYTVMPTWHPAYITRNRAALEDLTNDLRKAYRKSVGALDSEQLIKTRMITDLNKFRKWVNKTVRLSKAGVVERVSYDLETSGPLRVHAFDAYHPDSYIIGICLARDEREGVFFAIEHRGCQDPKCKCGGNIPAWNPGHDKTAIKALLKKLFKYCRIVTHNGKFDIRFTTAKFGVYPKALRFDTKYACYLVDGKDGNHSLKYLAQKHLRFGQWDDELEELLQKVPSKRRTFDHVPLKMIAKYGAIDAVATHRLVPVVQREKLAGKTRTRLLFRKFLESLITFNELEAHGNRVDKVEWDRLKDEYLHRGNAMLEKIRATPAGRATEKKAEKKLNLASAPQMRYFVHECLKVPVNKEFLALKTKQPSLSDEAMIAHIAWAEQQKKAGLAKLLTDIRETKKIKSIRSKYLVSLDKFIVGDVLHPNYYFHVQHTGRASTRSPTIHTIPYGSDIRRLFVSKWFRKGGLILSCDYSQLELRVLAMLSADPQLRATYERGEDVHAAVAAQIYGWPIAKIKGTSEGKQKRRHTKTVVFGIIYGRGAKAIAKATGLTEYEAQQVIDRLFQEFPAVLKYIDKQHTFARKYELVESPTGRIFPLPHIAGGHQDLVAKAERQAQNYPIQGGASDITLFSILDTHRDLRRNGHRSHIYDFVHDCQMVDIAPGEFGAVYDTVIDTMEKGVLAQNPVLLDWVNVPLKVEAEIGVRWDGGMAIEKTDDGVFTLKGPVPFYKELYVAMRGAYPNVTFKVVKQWEDEDWNPFGMSARQAYSGEAAGRFRCEVEMRIAA